MTLSEKFRNIIQDNIVVFDGEADFSDDDNFFELGFVNSLFAMKLVSFIETEFDFQIENEDLELSNFNTINNIVAFVHKKVGNVYV